MSYKLDRALKAISELDQAERATLDEKLISMIGDDAIAKRREYGFELASDYIDEARELVHNWGKMQGMSSGYRLIDRLMKGIVPGELIVIGGPTSNGKTTLAVNVGARVVASGVPVLFVTLEMTKAKLTSRMMVAEPRFEDNAALLAYQKADEFSWQSVDGLVENSVKNLGVRLVIIDHLHYFTRELHNVAEDLGRITKEFKKNAIRHSVPIMLISHTRKGDGASIDDLRGSSYIAQDADIVLMVARDKVDSSLMSVAIHKNRDRGFDYQKNEIFLTFDKMRLSEPTPSLWH